MKIFISGVAGFLGSHLAEHCLAHGHSVSGIDDLSGGSVDNVPAGVDFLISDCCTVEDYAPLLRGCEVVFHCAASAHDGFSIWAPTRIYRDTVQTTIALASAAANCGVRRFVSCSSMARYGHAREGAPFTESSPPSPVTPYAQAKVAAEQGLRTIAELHGVEWNIAIPHNIYGPRQNRSDPYRNVVAIMMNRVLQGLPPIVYGDGQQVRCFSYVDDVVEPLALLGTRPDIMGQHVNLGPDSGEVTVLELARRILRSLDVDLPIQHVAQRPFEVHTATCSAGKARELLGYQANVPLDEGLARTAHWIRQVGPLPFRYNRQAEITDERMPRTWSERML